MQELVGHFWKRWMREWLPSLSTRYKWNQEKCKIKIDDIVLTIPPDTTREHWPLGRITKAFEGKDGCARVVKVKISEKVFIRPITRMCFEFDN